MFQLHATGCVQGRDMPAYAELVLPWAQSSRSADAVWKDHGSPAALAKRALWFISRPPTFQTCNIHFATGLMAPDLNWLTSCQGIPRQGGRGILSGVLCDCEPQDMQSAGSFVEPFKHLICFEGRTQRVMGAT